jgi:hypothetical protein
MTIARNEGEISIINAVISGDIDKLFALTESDKILVRDIVNLTIIPPMQAALEDPANPVSTPFMMAAAQGHHTVIYYLLWLTKRYDDGLVDLDLLDSKGMNALMYAALNGHHAIVSLLITSGCDPRIRFSRPDSNNKSISIAEMARSNQHEDVARLLEAASDKKNQEKPALHAQRMFLLYGQDNYKETAEPQTKRIRKKRGGY